MATNKERLDSLMTALYADAATPEKTASFTSAVLQFCTDQQSQEKFGCDKSALNDNQKAWFVLDRIRDEIKAIRKDGRLCNARAAAKAARDAFLNANPEES